MAWASMTDMLSRFERHAPNLTDSLKLQMEMNYHVSVDGEGYFRTLPSGEGYVEIISYDKLMRDAK